MTSRRNLISSGLMLFSGVSHGAISFADTGTERMVNKIFIVVSQDRPSFTGQAASVHIAFVGGSGIETTKSKEFKHDVVQENSLNYEFWRNLMPLLNGRDMVGFLEYEEVAGYPYFVSVFNQGSDVLSPIFADSGLTNTQQNPVRVESADDEARIFLVDGSYRIRITDKNGDVHFEQDNILLDRTRTDEPLLSFSTVGDLESDVDLGYDFSANRTVVRDGQIVKVVKGMFYYTVAPQDFAQPHLVTAGGIKLCVIPRSDSRIAIEAFGVDTSDETNDQSAKIQLAMNVAQQNGSILTFPQCRIRADELWFAYDAVHNPGMSPQYRHWGIEGYLPPSTSALETSTTHNGTFLFSTNTAQTPFASPGWRVSEFNFASRGFQMRNMTFEAGTDADVPVLDLSGFQSFRLDGVSVLQTSDGGDGLLLNDADQWIIHDLKIWATDAATSDGTGLVIDFPNIDASRCRIEGCSIQDWKRAVLLTSSNTDTTIYRLRDTIIDGLQIQSCREGLRLRNCSRIIVNAPQIRALDTGIHISGLCDSLIFNAAEIQTFETIDASGHACVVLGTTGTESFNGVEFNGCSFDLPSTGAAKYAVRWRAGGGSHPASNRDTVAFYRPYVYFRAGAADGDGFIRFTSSVTGGGHVIEPSFSGGAGASPNRAQLITHASQYRLLSSLSFGFDKGPVTGKNCGRFHGTLFGDAGGKGSQTNVVLDIGRVHDIIGTSGVETFTFLGHAPQEGDQIVVLAKDGFTLKSQRGGGSGNGNIDIRTGDVTLAAGDAITLTYINGGWIS